MIDTTFSWMSEQSRVTRRDVASSISFDAFLDAVPDAIVLVDASDTVVVANDPAAAMFGYARDELLGKHLDALVFERPRRERGLQKSAGPDRWRAAKGDQVGCRADGTTFPAQLKLFPIRSAEPGLRYVSIRDVSEQRRADAKIRASLREKEVLLREVHHRVKNNLQIVSSMLRLQRDQLSDPKALELFTESQTRVRSIALFHEKLYQSRNLARIDSAEYLRGIATLLFSTYGVSVDRIALTVVTEGVSLGMDAALLCGLIVNELVSNSLKYAFRDRTAGSVEISLRREGRETVLGVADDGVGLPEGAFRGRGGGLGLKLVRTLVHQMHGAIRFETGNGTRVFARFPSGAQV